MSDLPWSVSRREVLAALAAAGLAPLIAHAGSGTKIEPAVDFSHSAG